MSVRVRIGAVVAVLLWALPGAIPAAAQGNGRGNAYGHNKRPSGNTSTPAPGSSAAPSAGGGAAADGGSSFALPEGTGVRAFGSWLDDASVMTPGTGYASFAFSYWRLPGFTEIDVPALDVGIGLTPRLQVSASVPVYHASEPGGPVVRGVGDFQLSSKFQLRDPAAGTNHQIGLAVIPMVEILSSTPAPGSSRVNWALPASIEWRLDGWRTYGTAGYFSRGAVFTSGAVEVPLSDRTWVTGTISQSRSIKRDDLSEALGLPKVRTDVAGGATVLVSNALAVFGSVGRTLSTTDPNRADLFAVGGVAVNFVAWSQ